MEPEGKPIHKTYESINMDESVVIARPTPEKTQTLDEALTAASTLW